MSRITHETIDRLQEALNRRYRRQLFSHGSYPLTSEYIVVESVMIQLIGDGLVVDLARARDPRKWLALASVGDGNYSAIRLTDLVPEGEVATIITEHLGEK